MKDKRAMFTKIDATEYDALYNNFHALIEVAEIKTQDFFIEVLSIESEDSSYFLATIKKIKNEAFMFSNAELELEDFEFYCLNVVEDVQDFLKYAIRYI